MGFGLYYIRDSAICEFNRGSDLMEYITAEQFLEQDEKVQKVFLEWWKPSVGDLYYNKSHKKAIQCFEWLQDINDFKLSVFGWSSVDDFKELCIPLLTIGHLIKFIEDKTGMKVIFEYTCCENIVIKLLEYNKVTGGLEYKFKMTFPQNKYSLIEAFWTVSCMRARGGING
jgi:hypothetical protein